MRPQCRFTERNVKNNRFNTYKYVYYTYLEIFDVKKKIKKVNHCI